MPRVAIAGMILESNRFAKPADKPDFVSVTWESGDALLAEARAETPALAAEFAAFVRAMDATGPWDPVPCLLAAARPAGPVREDVFEEVANSIVKTLEDAGPVDAVYLCGHGAMVAEHLHDPDGELAKRVRNCVGGAPIVIMTLDLHANISQLMVDSTDVIIGYRTNPHVDMIERGEEAAFTMRRILNNAKGKRPQQSLRRPPIAPASVTLLTAEGPYADLIDYGQRRQAELAGAILNVSVFGNFIFSDTPDNTLSVVVTAREDQAIADELANEIAQVAWADRHRFVRDLTPLSNAVDLALDGDRNPIIYSDAGDNPGGGGSGRTTALLAALHKANANDVFIGSFFDPDLAAEAHTLGMGTTFRARFNRHVGDDVWEQWDTPFEAEAVVVGLSDGQAVGTKGLFAGRKLNLGPSAALKLGGITVVVISHRTQTADPVFFTMLGLKIEDAQTIVVKSRGHFRAGFLPWFSPDRVYEVDTAGLTSPVLSRWPFQHVPRPSFPLDPDTTWAAASD